MQKKEERWKETMCLLVMIQRREEIVIKKIHFDVISTIYCILTPVAMNTGDGCGCGCG